MTSTTTARAVPPKAVAGQKYVPTHAIAEVTGRAQDYDHLIEAIGDASIVLIGEASHGTQEFYSERARITTRLIQECGFNAVAIEGDWPDAHRVDRYVRGMDESQGGAKSARDALRGFQRFPSWMWANHVVANWLDWLQYHNSSVRDPAKKVGFFGLDLYSMSSSMNSVVSYLQQRDPRAAAAARHRYACFDQVGISDPEQLGQQYGYAVSAGRLDPCEDAVVAQLTDLVDRRADFLTMDGRAARDEYFAATRNAILVHNAELYYREMYYGAASSWNLRDSHMVDTLAAIRAHLGTSVDKPRIVVWAHNSHVGDARATELARPDRPGGERQYNLGQLVRQKWPGESFILGLTTNEGSVTAATDWGGPALTRHLRPAHRHSFEHVFHTWDSPAFYALVDDQTMDPKEVRLERAIGVIYRPETERASHWFAARMFQQFDGVLHIDRTAALRPLEPSADWDRAEPPETYPTGL